MKRVFLFLSVIFIIGFLSCENDEPTNDSISTRYPAEVGNHWTYNRLYVVKFDTVLPGFDSIIGSGYSDTIFSTTYVEVESEKAINDTLTAYEFVEYHNNGNVDVSYTYFTNDETGFYRHAYKDVGEATPAKNCVKIVFNGQQFSSPEELSGFITRLVMNNGSIVHKADTVYPPDSLYIESPPVKSLSYPLDLGKEWVYKSWSTSAIEIRRKIVSTETVATEVGNITCYKIQFLYHNVSMEHEFYIYNYISGHGLVKSFLFAEIWFSDGEGNIIATGTITEDLSLTDYYIQ